MRYLALFALMAVASPASAEDLSACHFGKVTGTCSAVFSIDKSTHIYRVVPTGACMTVTVLIDGTQYPHRMKDAPVVDSVMVIDKTRDYQASLSGCTLHPTKDEVLAQCKERVGRAQPCVDEGLAAIIACWKSKGSSCPSVAAAAVRSCAEPKVDAGNACMQSTVFSYEVVMPKAGDPPWASPGLRFKHKKRF